MESWNPSKEKLIYNPTTVFFLNFVILFACWRRQVKRKKIKTILMFSMRYKKSATGKNIKRRNCQAADIGQYDAHTSACLSECIYLWEGE